MADDVVILEPGDERAQKISKAMASQTASDILKLLAETPKSLTEITDRLSIPLTTAKYHIENLLEAGLILVAETKYSVKGREIKIYAITNQLLIVAPRQSNVRSLLLKYASLFGIVIFGSLAISVLSPLLRTGTGEDRGLINGAAGMAAYDCGTTPAVTQGLWPPATVTPELMGTVSKGIAETAVENITPASTAFIPPAHISPAGGGAASAIMPDIALAFFLGGAIVIFILLIYEVHLWKKMKT